MICASSHRPHAKDAVYAANQIAAHDSWKKVFRQIFYFGNPEPDLADVKTTRFVPLADPFSEWPTIKEMLSFLGAQPHMSAMINADIIVTEKVAKVQKHMIEHSIQAATSKRWCFNKPDRSDAAVIDRGLDIFIAAPYLWRTLAREIPSGYRMGHCEWDTWVLGKLMQKTHWKMADFTFSSCVFHPFHGGRNMPLNAQVPKMPETIYDFAKIPSRKIIV